MVPHTIYCNGLPMILGHVKTAVVEESVKENQEEIQSVAGLSVGHMKIAVLEKNVTLDRMNEFGEKLSIEESQEKI